MSLQQVLKWSVLPDGLTRILGCSKYAFYSKKGAREFSRYIKNHGLEIDGLY